MSLEGATLEGAMLHTAFMLTTRGTPQLYSGEEIAMEGKEDPDNRRDFPGGFPGDKHNAFLASQRTAREQRMWQWTHDWIEVRRGHSAIRDGRLIDLFCDDDVYAFARMDSTETVIIAINRPTKVLGLINQRPLIEKEIENRIRPEAEKSCVTIREVRLGEPAIPPELPHPDH